MLPYSRQTTLVDLSRAMLERAGRNIVTAGGAGDDDLPPHVRLLQADLLALQLPTEAFANILGLGVTHLFQDVPTLVAALRPHLAPAGELHLAGLVTETRRGRRFLELLHRAGEVAFPMSAEELWEALGRPPAFKTTGCMAYATIHVA